MIIRLLANTLSLVFNVSFDHIRFPRPVSCVPLLNQPAYISTCLTLDSYLYILVRFDVNVGKYLKAIMIIFSVCIKNQCFLSCFFASFLPAFLPLFPPLPQKPILDVLVWEWYSTIQCSPGDCVPITLLLVFPTHPLLLYLLCGGMDRKNGGTKGEAYKLGKEPFTGNSNGIKRMKSKSNHINNRRVQERGEQFTCKGLRTGFTQLLPLPCLPNWKRPHSLEEIPLPVLLSVSWGGME